LTVLVFTVVGVVLRVDVDHVSVVAMVVWVGPVLADEAPADPEAEDCDVLSSTLR
jgi:hypothetical protein